MAKEIDRRISEIQDRQLNVAFRYNWRVVWKFFKDGVEIENNSKDFTNGTKADEFVTLLRKKATNQNLGVLVEKVSIKQNKRKRYTKGYRRKW